MSSLVPRPPSTLQKERGVWRIQHFCRSAEYSPDPPFLFGGGSGNETNVRTAVTVRIK